MYVQSVTKIECKSAATESYEKLSNKNEDSRNKHIILLFNL